MPTCTDPTTAGGTLGTVVMDVVRYESMFRTNSLSAFDDEARLYRWTANPATGRVTEQLLDDHVQEFPRHDDRLTGTA